MLAPCPPVTNPNEASSGSPSRSFSHPPATSSTTAAAGEVARLNAGWSHPTASMSAAVAASSAPPITNPKYRGPVVPTRPGSTASTSWSTTSAAGTGPSGSSPNAARRSSTPTPAGNAARSPTSSR